MNYVPMPRVAPTVHLPARDIERRKQARCPVALVVVRHAGRKPRPHREDRLRAVQRLDLRLLVDAQHQRPLRWVEVEPHDVGQLAAELQILAELERLDSVRLQPVLLPDPVHSRVAQTDLLRESASAPVRLDHRRLHGRSDACSCAAVIVFGLPDRARVRMPTKPSARYRRRHGVTVFIDTLRRSAVARTPSPPAPASRTCARTASSRGTVRARSHDSSTSRSAFPTFTTRHVYPMPVGRRMWR